MKTPGDEEWIAKLKGCRGVDLQDEAFQDLGKILHTAVFNYLLNHQRGLAKLASFSREELANFANDFVQETLEKISVNQFRILDQFKGSGSLKAWAIRIACRQAGQELRRPYWHNTETSPDEVEQIETSLKHSTSQEDMTAGVLWDEMVAEVWPKAERCIDGLTERQRIAFLNVVVGDKSEQEVAEELHSTVNTVYILVCRAKKALRVCLDRAGVGPDILEGFSEAVQN